MSADSILSSAIEVAIGIAGFAGIVAALRQRDIEAWLPAHRILLQALFSASIAALAFAFLPGVLTEAGLAEGQVWRLGSALYLAFFVTSTLVRRRQAAALHADDYVALLPRWITAWIVALQALLLLNLFLATAWPYLLVLIGTLGNGFMVFLALLLGGVPPKRPQPDHSGNYL